MKKVDTRAAKRQKRKQTKARKSPKTRPLTRKQEIHQELKSFIKDGERHISFVNDFLQKVGMAIDNSSPEEVFKNASDVNEPISIMDDIHRDLVEYIDKFELLKGQVKDFYDVTGSDADEWQPAAVHLSGALSSLLNEHTSNFAVNMDTVNEYM